MNNPCLRPACLSDVPHGRVLAHRHVYQCSSTTVMSMSGRTVSMLVDGPLKALYDAEWRKRGFVESP